MANTFLSFKVWVGKNNLKKQKKNSRTLNGLQNLKKLAY